MPKLLKFHRKQFYDNPVFGWHLMNDAQGQQGEFTLCGIAYDGDATEARVKPEYKEEGKVTCKNCINVIKLCKSIKL